MRPEILQTVIRDVQLEAAGASVYFVVDPYDLIEFCFPVLLGDLKKHRSVDDVADAQAALFEIVYIRDLPPVLLEEYADELDRTFAYLHRDLNQAMDKTKLLQALILRAQSDRSALVAELRQGLKSRDDVRGFNVVLAVVMGIYSLGAQRLEEVYNRLARPVDDELQPVLWQISADYSETTLVQEIYQAICRSVARRNLASARTDAQAIDRLLFINHELERAFQRGSLSHRYVFLYLSSASRSENIFQMASVQERLPVVDGKRYSIYRTPEHIFTYVVNKVDAPDRATRLQGTLERLRTVYDLLKWNQVNRLARKLSATVRENCPICVLDGATGDDCKLCPNVTKCLALLELDLLPKKQRDRMQDLGLVAAVKQYRDLAMVTADDADSAKFLDYFQVVFSDPTVTPRAQQRLLDLHKLMRLQVRFKAFLYGSTPSGEHRLTHPGGQLVYLFSPALRGRNYDEVLSKLAQSEKATVLYERFGAYDDAIRIFTELEGALELLTEEHELVRCILYLIFPTPQGMELAYSTAQELFSTTVAFKAEFTLILCSSAILLGKFEEAEAHAIAGALASPKDARLHNARAASILKHIEARPTLEVRSELLRVAIDEEGRAISLATGHSEFDRLRAVSYNNLAYCYCLEPWSDEFDGKRVDMAREAINEVKRIVLKENWLPCDVQFFHTEAQVEYYEAHSARRASKMVGADIQRRGLLAYGTFKLDNAQREIDIAIEARPDVDLYKVLKQEIEILRTEIEVDIKKLIHKDAS